MGTLDTLITLDDAETMLERLRDEFDNDSYDEERLFPLLLQKAGRQYNLMGVFNIATFSIAAFTTGMGPAGSLINAYRPKVLKALLPTNSFDEAILLYKKEGFL